MGDARFVALQVLEKCRRAGAWSDAVLGSVMDANGLLGRDRSFCAALCYGVLQNRMLLDHLIEGCSLLPFGKIEPKVLDLLRLSAYQILFMDRVPNAAAVDSAVQLSKRLRYARASGFVNAVLRHMAAGQLALPAEQTAEALSLRWSHPLWLTERFISLLGQDEAARLLECDNAPVPITVQTNTLRTDTETLLSSLLAKGLSAQRHPWLPDCIQISGGSVQALPEFQNGEFYVQDAAAKLAVTVAGPQKGQRILDVCAAPGGKTFAAAILSGGAEIIACDLHENKLKRIAEGAKRLGLEKITLRAMDARAFQPEYREQFDLVIADVPCSGLGVIRKKPDVRYKSPDTLSGLPKIQSEILKTVSAYVKPGGTLLYSTCTVLPEENSDVCTAFLDGNADFTYEDFNLPDGSESQNGMLQLWPQRHGTDGFFIAKLRKWKNRHELT